MVLPHEHAATLVLAAYIVCRRYWSINLKEVRKLGTAQGGEYVDDVRFTYEGDQIRSLLSLLSYFGKGEMRERSFGIKIPPTNLKSDFGAQAQAFADKLADRLGPSSSRGGDVVQGRCRDSYRKRRASRGQKPTLSIGRISDEQAVPGRH